MANDEHIAQLMKGVAAWNKWRDENPNIERPDISGAKLRQANLSSANLVGGNLGGADLFRAILIKANLRATNLSKADLSGATLNSANLREADLREANLFGADLSEADLSKADLRGTTLYSVNLSEADLSKADLSKAGLIHANLKLADLREADLREADLRHANLSVANLGKADLRGADLADVSLVNADLRGADLTGCRVYGLSAWNLKLEDAKQQNLIITPRNEPAITVDNIEVAQFIYLLLHNQKVRDVIDTITSKVVLILGRFTDERKAVLDALRDELRNRNLLPILFDFAMPASRDVTETIKTLASLARFVIADVTDATEVRVELHNVVPDFTSLPVQLIVLRGHSEFVSLSHLTKFAWVLPIFEYDDEKHLLASLDKSVVGPAEDMTRKLRT
jgi:uncharacterized protein YjbI with pentapeptide repeats